MSVQQQQQKLSANIHLLGDLLGETIIEQEGRELFELEEQIRGLAKAWRGGEDDVALQAGEQIKAMIPGLVDDLPKALAVLKAQGAVLVEVTKPKTDGKDPEKMFAGRDTNKDGQLDKAELSAPPKGKGKPKA